LPLSVGWWISVCTQVASSRSLRPLVTFACRANCTTRTLSAMQGLGLQGIGPAEPRRIIGHRSPVQSAEPAQDQVLIHLLFGFLITPLVEVLEDEHTQQYLHRRRV